MNEGIVQHQIKLLGFRATRFSFKTEANPDKKAALNKNFNINLDNVMFKDNPNYFTKVFLIDIVYENDERDEIYDLSVEYHTIFECDKVVTAEFLESDFAKISAPAIGFPYVRAFISNYTIQAGLPPLILPSINFIQFNKETDQAKTKKA